MIGEALRLIRVFHDRTSKDMADDLGISRSYLSEIEHGHKQPSLELIGRFAKVLGTKPSVILFFADKIGEDLETESAHMKTRKRLIAFLQAMERMAQIEDEA